MVELPSVLLKFIKKGFKELSAYYSQYDSGKKGNKISLFLGDFLKFVKEEKDSPKVEWPDVKEMKELKSWVNKTLDSLKDKTDIKDEFLIDLIREHKSRPQHGGGPGINDDVVAGSRPEDDEDDYECSVCLEPIKVGDRIAKCEAEQCESHIFHKACLESWISTGNNNCPLCRNDPCDTSPAARRLHQEARMWEAEAAREEERQEDKAFFLLLVGAGILASGLLSGVPVVAPIIITGTIWSTALYIWPQARTWASRSMRRINEMRQRRQRRQDAAAPAIELEERLLPPGEQQAPEQLPWPEGWAPMAVVPPDDGRSPRG